ncbi:MAG: M50 family metallopeptidase [Candidatus Aenigmatarchaeota archaeon]
MGKNIINFIVVTIIALISLTYVHEIGHATMAKMYDCDSKSIIFDNSLVSYTIVSCKKGYEMIALGGLIFSSLFSLLFIIFGREYFLMSISLSILLSLEDLSLFLNPLLPIGLAAFLSFLSYFYLFDSSKLKKKENFL